MAAQSPGDSRETTELVASFEGEGVFELRSDDPRLADRVGVVHWPGDGARARRVMEVLERRSDLPGLPAGFPSYATFFLAPDEAIWTRLVGEAVPHWGAGVAIPSRAIAVLPLFRAPGGGLADRDRTVLHEWAHLGLHEYLSGLRIPRWFDEGYAQWASGGWDFAEAWRLRLALAGSGAPPLDSLTLEWPRDRPGAEVAYLLSASAVEYLVSSGGERGMGIFLDRWREIGDFEEAFRQTFGSTTASFEARWIAHVERRYGWVIVFQQMAFFWLIAGFALLLLVKRRAGAERERLARMRATDPPDRPAYWEEPRVEPESREPE